MKVSTSILSIKENLQNNIEKLNMTGTDYIHLDIMDGLFVPNKTWEYEEIEGIVNNSNKPLDIHLMVEDLDKYINSFSKLNPMYITFHLETTKDILKYINIIKSKKIKVGLSIKPNTEVSLLESFFPYLDLVLVMSVEPGAGGQTFITDSLDKIKLLKQLREKNNYNYVIEVDGGINEKTCSLVKEAGVDIAVSGSFIVTSNDYEKQIQILKQEINQINN